MEPKEGLIEKFRTVAKAFKRSQRRLRDLESYCKDHNEKFRSPMVDVATRWNSTYDMIDRLFSMRRTISYLIDKPKYLEDKENRGLQVHITNMEWDAIRRLRDVLVPFQEATLMLSGSSYVTLSLALPILFTLQNDVINVINSDEDVLETSGWSVEGMTATFNKYLELMVTNKAAVIATVLDPRFNSRFFVGRTPNQSQVESWVKGEYDKIKVDVMEASQESPPKKSLKSRIFTHPVVTDELQEYFKCQRAGEDSEPIKWWQSRKTSGGRLHILALRYLSIPASSVPSEQMFSKAGTVVTKKRNRLNSKKIEQILCTESFWKLE